MIDRVIFIPIDFCIIEFIIKFIILVVLKLKKFNLNNF
jgi:hypothetical protein